MPIEIEEILRRSEQGATEPYICRGADNRLYYVKGKGAGYESLVKEWIAGNIAIHLGLPIAPFKLVYVAKELYDAGRSTYLRDLGYGQLFGSEYVLNSNEISIINAGMVSPEMKRDIAAFDWWVKNGDRTLSEAGGNPNILWSETEARPWIIDHNLAFDRGVTLRSLLEGHIFGESLRTICATPALRSQYNAKFKAALSHLDEIINDIPERWHYLDDAETMEIGFSIESIGAVLERYQEQAFWEPQ